MRAEVPDPKVQPTMTPAEVAPIFKASLPTIYQAIERGEIPSIRLGRKIVIPTAALRRLLSLDEPEAVLVADPEVA